jgi:hypothetical protein
MADQSEIRNPKSAMDDDLATALARFADAGEALAMRCRQEDQLYLGAALLAAMRRLQETAGHEFGRTRGERSGGVTECPTT